MYLGVAFLRTRLRMKKLADAGPDFAVEIGPRRFWVEATAPSAGAGPDQVPEEQDYDGGIISPTEKILLRFTHSLLEKQKQYCAALADGLIRIEDGYILAVNSRAIPHAAFGDVPPFPVQAFFPFGQRYLRYEPRTGKIVESGFERRDIIEKANKASVSTAAFLDPGYSWVSAVLHSTVDPVHLPRRLGEDFELIHNPLATHPIPHGPFSDWVQFSFDTQRSRLIYSKPGFDKTSIDQTL